MSEDATRSTAWPAAKLVTPIFVIAAIAVVIVFDPLAALADTPPRGGPVLIPVGIGLDTIGLPDMPGWLNWIGDLPGPGLLIVIIVLVLLGESGRRTKGDPEDRP